MTRPLRLLFLLPFAPDLRGAHGGTRATAAIIDMLSRHHRLTVLYLAAPGDPPPRQLPASCERILAIPMETRASGPGSAIKRYFGVARRFLWGRPDWVEECWSPVMASRAATIAAEFEPDVVHYEFHVMAQYIPFVRSACPRAAGIVTEHEPGIIADAVRDAPPTLRERVARLARRRAWSRYERRTLRMADSIIVFTSSDAAALERLLGSSRPPISVVPLRLPAPDSPPAGTSAPIKSDFVFVGNFRHPPNADAARRLVRSIFPMILRKLPEATLTIVGADPPQDLVDAASDRVTVTGWVDDPSIYLAGAAVVLVPLRQGGGLRVKMLEACAAGKAIVASPMAVEGLSLETGQEVMIAQTDEEFAEIAIALMEDPEARTRLEGASRRWWEDEHDVGRWSAQYAGLYASLGVPRDKGR
jgi:polysaccharide biosynthesis protein PslH